MSVSTTKLVAINPDGHDVAQTSSKDSEGPIVYSEDRPLVIGVVLFDDFEPLDVFGPIEIFGALGKKTKIITLAEKVQLSRPRFGPSVQVDRSLDEAGPLDLLLIPGGSGTRLEVDNPAFIASLKRLAESTPHVASVCTGSGLLARTGLLSGRNATSNKRAFQWAVAQDRSVHWLHEARWVVDGKYATSSGVSAGIDLALGIVGSLFDHDTAVKIAQNVEYVWNEDSTKDPFAALNANTAYPAPVKSYPLQGVIVEVLQQRQRLRVKHQKIPGVMEAMTMLFKADADTLSRVHPDEVITADLVQVDGDYWIKNIKQSQP